MIKFSDRQLRIPMLARPVYLVTAGQTMFDRAFPGRRTEELCVEAFCEAAALIDKTPAELKSYIHTAYYGHFADHFGDQLLGEAVIHDRLGLHTKAHLDTVATVKLGKPVPKLRWKNPRHRCRRNVQHHHIHVA